MLPEASSPAGNSDRWRFPGPVGALAAAVIAVPAWSGVLALDERWAVLAAPLLGVIVARGFALAVGRIDARALTPVAGMTVAAVLAGESLVAEFIARENTQDELRVLVRSFRDLPCWGALALVAALAGAWWAVRAMAPRVAPDGSRAVRTVLARAAARPR
ncbi:MAG TPA: hypothetical protein VFK69_03145 [Candidatus Eisenbacteria bacterium]|nr:hypothetical protein [Candidatus Eisenbacteria bacterium]